MNLRPPRAQAKARALGLTSATGLVVGSIVGTGIFAMPAVLRRRGTSSLLVLGVIAVGAMLLAALFGQLTPTWCPSAAGVQGWPLARDLAIAGPACCSPCGSPSRPVTSRSTRP